MAGHYPCTLQATNTRCGRRPGHPRVPSRLSAPREANLRLSGLRIAMPRPFVQSVLSRRQPPPKQRTLYSRRGQRSPQRADSGNGPAAPLLPRGLASRAAVGFGFETVVPPNRIRFEPDYLRRYMMFTTVHAATLEALHAALRAKPAARRPGGPRRPRKSPGGGGRRGRRHRLTVTVAAGY